MTPPLETPLVFRCGRDQLVGIVHASAPVQTDIGVLVIVGGPQYRVGSHRQFTLMARSLAGRFPVMRFDYRGMGDSEGDPRGFESIEEDIRSALGAFASAVPTVKRIVLWGLCDAASAALMSGAADPRVAGLILANPWVRTQSGEARAFVRHYYGQRFLQRAFWAKLLSGGVNPIATLGELAGNIRRASSRRQARAVQGSFVDRMRRGLAEFTGPVLMLISERDLTAGEFVDLCSSSPEWKRTVARANVRLVRLPGADHTFSRRESLDQATEHCRRLLEAMGASDVSGYGAH